MIPIAKNKTVPFEYDDFKKYSIAEISEMLGIGKTKTREMLQSKLLPVTKVGRDYFTSPKAIQEFLKKKCWKGTLFLKLSTIYLYTIMESQWLAAFL